MSRILDNLAEIRKLDSKDMLGSLHMLSKQVEQVQRQAKTLKIPSTFKKINQVVVLGMGGSSIGTHIIKTLFSQDLHVPIEIVNDYRLPKYVNKKTLVVGSSYSGTTEETVFAAKEALKRKAHVVMICSGGELQKIAQKNKLPALIFTTENNPCGSPRMGLGYSIVGQLVLFASLGLIRLSSAQIKKIVAVIAKYDETFGVENPENNNRAKQLAQKSVDRSVWYVASEHLLGNAHVAANQMNENGKRFAGYHAIPELNHHLMEGMMHPGSNKDNLLFVLFESHLYHTRNQKRYEVTKQVLSKNSIQFEIYKCEEKDRLLQACEVLVLGSYASYYSALLKGIDPTAIPFVDFFKRELKK